MEMLNPKGVEEAFMAEFKLLLQKYDAQLIHNWEDRIIEIPAKWDEEGELVRASCEFYL